MDRFSPFAPAHVCVQVIPVGNIDQNRFLDFIERLQDEVWNVMLFDIDRYLKDGDLLLSPKTSPRSCILYNYTTSVLSPEQQQQQPSPFELFREPLLVLGIIDGQVGKDGADQTDVAAAADYLQKHHPRVVHRQVLVLDKAKSPSSTPEDNAIRIANAARRDRPALQDAMTKVSARFLRELSTYTIAMQASPSVQTPGQTARSLQRTTSQREQERRPPSGRSTPTHSGETEEDGGVKLPPLNRGSPATSFDQIPSANNTTSGISRSDSGANKGKHVRRASSQDRVSVQGFGSGTSQDKLKQRGKARVGIVTGTIYMAAGLWAEAMRILVENTNNARRLSDHIWHAKGLENILICLLLHLWIGFEFQIPSICYPITDKSSSQQRHSVSLPSDFKPGDASQVASVRRLSTSLPDLLKLILSLYCSVEGSLELPFHLISEATIRFSKLLAVLHNAGGELDHATLDHFIGSRVQRDFKSSQAISKHVTGSMSKLAIADMLSHAYPTNDDVPDASAQVTILSGIASVYALLHMDRKTAMILRDLVTKLTTALTKARKRGAAEAGIHPAASLSAEAGDDDILALIENSEGVNKMMAGIARVYGIQLPIPPIEREGKSMDRLNFGNDNLKSSVLKDLGAFCEAIPDPHGVLKMAAAVFNSMGPYGALDAGAERYSGSLSKEDQTRLITTMGRTVGVAKHLGLPKAEAVYWDRFLVRDVEFASLCLDREDIIPRKGKTPATAAPAAGGNPLLYDPNASRPGTAQEAAHPQYLVATESRGCIVKLQNPYDVPIDIESLNLETDGPALQTNCAPFTLQPSRLQDVPMIVIASTPGQYKITHVRVKVSGCVEDVFPIVKKPWIPDPPVLVKEIGQDAGEPKESLDAQGLSAEHAFVNVTVIKPQPMLGFDDNSHLEPSLMILEGETRRVAVAVRNESAIPLSIFNIALSAMYQPLSTSSDRGPARRLPPKSIGPDHPIILAPGQRNEIGLYLHGRRDVSTYIAVLYYSRFEGGEEYARVLYLPIRLTVNATVQAQNLIATPLSQRENPNMFLLSFDLRNGWPEQLGYRADSVPMARGRIHDILPRPVGILLPGQVKRVCLVMPRLVLPPGTSAKKVTKDLMFGILVTWTSTDREGEVDFGALTLSDDSVEVVLKPSIHIELHLIGTNKPIVQASALSVPTVKVESFVTLVAKVTASEKISEPLFVQLHNHSPTSISVSGDGHKVLEPSKEAGSTWACTFSVCPLLAGTAELEVTAKPVKSSGTSRPLARSTVRVNIV